MGLWIFPMIFHHFGDQPDSRKKFQSVCKIYVPIYAILHVELLRLVGTSKFDLHLNIDLYLYIFQNHVGRNVCLSDCLLVTKTASQNNLHIFFNSLFENSKLDLFLSLFNKVYEPS